MIIASLKHSQDVIHPCFCVDTPHESAVASIVDLVELLVGWFDIVPEMLEVDQVGKQIGVTSEKSQWHSNIFYITYLLLTLHIGGYDCP